MINVKPLGLIERLLDMLFLPIMFIVSGTFREKPQMTHRWNNHHLNKAFKIFLKKKLMLSCRGRRNERVQSNKGVRFHLPVFGGWKQYIVLEPKDFNRQYHIGWINRAVFGVSRIPLTGRVRLLAGPTTTHFFAIDSITGEQIPLKKVGQGVIGKRGQHCQVPLL